MQQAVETTTNSFKPKDPNLGMILEIFFIKEDMKANANFQALSKAGIGSAHSTVTNKRIDQLQSHTISPIEQNVMYEKTLIEMAPVVNTIQTNQLSVAPSAAAASEPKTEMQIILAAITNLSNPTPPVVTKPKTKMRQILALLIAKVCSKNGRSGGGGGCDGLRNNNLNNNCNGCCKVSTKPNLHYKFY